MSGDAEDRQGPEQEEPAAAEAAPEAPRASRRRPPGAALLVGGVALLVVAAFLAGTRVGGRAETPSRAPAADGDASPDDDIAWTCSMHPQIRSDHPGRCPICGMELVPVRAHAHGGGAAEPDAGSSRVTLSPRAKALARVRTAAVGRAAAAPVEVRLLGRVDYDERRVRTITSWTSGRIDRLHVAVTGQRVAAGRTVATLYSPEIYAAQADLIQAARQVGRLGGGTETARAAASAALEATRERLRLLGVPEDELRRTEAADRPFRQVEIRAPYGGTVIERLVDEGTYVNPGTGLYRVADLGRLWVQLDAYERDLAYVRPGQTVSLTISAFPGETFEGRIAFVDPVLDTMTRTTKVRVEVPNRGGRLQPGMFAEAVIEGGRAGEEGPAPLVVPASAPLFTGRRSIVYVEVPNAEEPTYEARVVRLGPRAGDLYPVVAGLAAGERVVVQGAFALDADLQIRGGRSMMAQPADDGGAGELAAVVDQGFLRALEPVVGSYLGVQERLAEDDLEAARAAMRQLDREVAGLDAPPGTEAEAWRAIAGPLGEAARAGAAAPGIEEARGDFERLSASVIALLGRFGDPLEAPLRLAFCPMAFSGRGAEWVQRGEAIDNPYFGATMRRCGEVRATVEPGRRLERPASAPGAAP